MIRKAKAVWRGTGRAGDGDITTESGVMSQTPYSFKTRFENEKGTNPEELIAAAHAGCFTMALAFGLQAAGITPTELATGLRSASSPKGRASASAARRSPCAPRCRASTRRNSSNSPKMPRRTARCRRC